MPLPLLFALLLQSAPEAAAPAPQTEPAPAEAPAAPAEEAWPAGAPRDDYQFVAWCYGTLRGYLDLHDQVMPEVTRIETAFRPPGRKLSDDLKVYADLQKQGQKDLKRFQAAMTAAEKASVRPLNQVGAAAVAKGHNAWSIAPGVTKARVAQEWMSWTLPARCQTTADSLAARSRLTGAALKANADSEPPAEPPAAPAEEPKPQS